VVGPGWRRGRCGVARRRRCGRRGRAGYRWRGCAGWPWLVGRCGTELGGVLGEGDIADVVQRLDALRLVGRAPARRHRPVLLLPTPSGDRRWPPPLSPASMRKRQTGVESDALRPGRTHRRRDSVRGGGVRRAIRRPDLGWVRVGSRRRRACGPSPRSGWPRPSRSCRCWARKWPSSRPAGRRRHRRTSAATGPGVAPLWWTPCAEPSPRPPREIRLGSVGTRTRMVRRERGWERPAEDEACWP
jgi:hypothetical protein